jgi:hypothetical protein
MLKRLNQQFFNSVKIKEKWAFLFYFGLSAIALIKVLFQPSNNYLIFKNTFFHLIHQQNLFLEYPKIYFDSNHYGPVFGLFIAPFALFPDYLGVSLWVVFNSILLFYAIYQLQLSKKSKLIILLICAHELMTANYSTQFNPAIAALIILSFTLIEERKEPWAAFCIILGTFIKLYGIVGLAFFFFVRNKPKFILWLILWSFILFILPMLFSSTSFVIQTYQDWYHSLVIKNGINTTSTMQDISVMGMLRRIFNYHQLSNTIVLIPGILLFCTSYLNIRSFKDTNFKLLILASTLIFTVIFSSSSESPTYIIAFVGLSVWFTLQPKPLSKLNWILLISALIISSLSPSDLFPEYIKLHLIRPYSLKELPCFLIWIKIIYETWVYRPQTINNPNIINA